MYHSINLETQGRGPPRYHNPPRLVTGIFLVRFAISNKFLFAVRWRVKSDRPSSESLIKMSRTYSLVIRNAAGKAYAGETPTGLQNSLIIYLFHASSRDIYQFPTIPWLVLALANYSLFYHLILL